jgi:hypothetical protein
MIRVLMLTQLYTSKKFTGISMVNYFRDLISSVRRVSAPGEFHWTIGVPSTHEFIQWSERELCTHDDISVLPILARDTVNRSKFRDGFAGQVFPWLSAEMFKFFASDDYFNFDIVLSNYYYANCVPAMYSVSAVSHKFKFTPKVVPPAIVNLLSETGEDKNLPVLDTDIGRNCIVNGILVSYLTVVLNRLDRDWAMKVLKERCSFSFVRRQDIRHIPPPVDLEVIPVPERPEERVVFFHGGSFEGKRHINVLVDAVRSLAGKGGARLLLATQFFADEVPEWARQSHVDLYTGVNREAYLNLFKDGDFLLCAADYEGTGLAYMEAIASGMTPVIWSRPWIAERIPLDYPFICESESDFRAAIGYCAVNPAEAKAKGRQAVEHIRKMYDPVAYGNTWAELLRAVFDMRVDHTRQAVGDHFLVRLAKKALEGKGRVPKQEFLRLMEMSAEKFAVKDFESMWPFLRAALLAHGFSESPLGWELR